jgi:hypothetical protein
MTTIAASPLTDVLQTLVDARLDTIDRMLLGRVNRQDRLAIVREVESQVFDLLQRPEGSPIDRDDVLAVLARLDPPEAYLPDDDSPVVAPRSSRIAVAPRAVPASRETQSGRLGLTGGVLGIVSLAIPPFFPIAELGEITPFFPIAELGEVTPGAAAAAVFFGLMSLWFLTALLAIIFAAMVRLRGSWPVVGLITGTIAMTTFVFYGIRLLMNV